LSLTFGNTSAPNSITTYLDSLFALSIANYRKTLTDNIGSANAVLHEILESDAYEECDGGTYIGEPLMYGLAPMDFYSGYDELSTIPTDGITQADFIWAQAASPIVYNMKEVFQNKNKIVDLVKSRIKQAEMGIQEGFAQAFLWGNFNNGGAITTEYVSPLNGSLGITPLPKLVSYNTSGSAGTALTVGGLNENSYSWWRNQYATSAATTYSGFIYELLNMYNTVALGTGGPPDLILMDQVTYQNAQHAYFSIYKHNEAAEDLEYPFENFKFKNARAILDDKIPDAFSGAPGTETGGIVSPSTLTYGSAYFVNTKFMKMRYLPERDWEMLTDENGKSFAKPINGDSRVGHIAWMGNTTMNNRRKQGVLAKIARSYSS
jgi:hypothetical protein